MEGTSTQPHRAEAAYLRQMGLYGSRSSTRLAAVIHSPFCVIGRQF